MLLKYYIKVILSIFAELMMYSFVGWRALETLLFVIINGSLWDNNVTVFLYNVNQNRPLEMQVGTAFLNHWKHIQGKRCIWKVFYFSNASQTLHYWIHWQRRNRIAPDRRLKVVVDWVNFRCKQTRIVWESDYTRLMALVIWCVFHYTEQREREN